MYTMAVGIYNDGVTGAAMGLISGEAVAETTRACL